MTHTSKSARDLTYRATFDGPTGRDAVNLSNDKERTDDMRVLAGKVGALETPVTALFWMGRSRTAQTVYCSVWIHPKDGADYRSGRGSAGGYGYHKVSAALEDALSAAGVVLTNATDAQGADRKGKRASIGGVGETAMADALLAVARAAGWRGPLEVV